MDKEKVHIRVENFGIGILNEIVVEIPAGLSEFSRKEAIEDEVLQAVTERVRYTFIEVYKK